MKIGSLIGSEDEPLVLYQRSANGAAVAVIVVGRFSRKCAGRDGLRSQVIQRIQIAILEILFTGSMPAVRFGPMISTKSTRVHGKFSLPADARRRLFCPQFQ